MGLFSKLRKQKQNDIVLDAAKKARISSTDKYNDGLKTSRDSFSKKFLNLATKYRKIDEDYFKELEELLITSDVGVQYTMDILPKIKDAAKRKNIQDAKKMNELIFEFLFEKYLDDKKPLDIQLADGELNIILVTGVNGVGKTTTIGKLANILLKQGKTVNLAAADTFRAGAVAQLKMWAEKNNCAITVPEKEGQDPASVAFKAIHNAKDMNADVLIIDTAGRLQNKENLMKELAKILKIIERESGKPPLESLLVLDATTGQNGVDQAAVFNDMLNLTGIILTKMDSSAKGGIILNIKENFSIPVKFIGLGEGIDDLEKFDLEKYLYGLTKELFDE